MTAPFHLTRRGVAQAAAAATALFAAAPVWAAQPSPRVVLITGASSGFGRAMAERFARDGSRVIATARDLQGRNATSADELRSLARTGLPIEVVEIDVLSDRSVVGGVERALELAGRIDILINNAAVVVPGPVELQSPHGFLANLDTNTSGSLRMNRAVIPIMRAQGVGAIIQMSSALGRAIDPMLGGYCASKLAVEAASDALSYELASSGIEVSVVQPAGAYPTRLQENARRYWTEMLSAEAPDPSLLRHYAPHVEAMLADLDPDPTLDPNEVVAAVVALADMPLGTRPSRLTVGPFKDGIDPVNAAHDRLQDDMIGHNRIVDLLTLTP